MSAVYTSRRMLFTYQTPLTAFQQLITQPGSAALQTDRSRLDRQASSFHSLSISFGLMMGVEGMALNCPDFRSRLWPVQFILDYILTGHIFVENSNTVFWGFLFKVTFPLHLLAIRDSSVLIGHFLRLLSELKKKKDIIQWNTPCFGCLLGFSFSKFKIHCSRLYRMHDKSRIRDKLPCNNFFFFKYGGFFFFL